MTEKRYSAWFTLTCRSLSIIGRDWLDINPAGGEDEIADPISALLCRVPAAVP
jgi:hypothetical protein